MNDKTQEAKVMLQMWHTNYIHCPKREKAGKNTEHMQGKQNRFHSGSTDTAIKIITKTIPVEYINLDFF